MVYATVPQPLDDFVLSETQPHQSVSGGPPASNFRKDSYILHLQRKWAEPNGVDVVLILRTSPQQLSEQTVKLDA